MSNPNRVLAGLPTGGQFTAATHPEGSISLTAGDRTASVDPHEYDRAHRYFETQSAPPGVDDMQQRLSSFDSPGEFAKWRTGRRRHSGDGMEADYRLFISAEARVAPPTPTDLDEDDLDCEVRCLEAELSDESDVVRLAEFASHEHPRLRAAVGGNPNTLQSTLRRLAVDDAPLVRRAAAANLADLEALRQLTSDSDPQTARTARRRKENLLRRDAQIHGEAAADFSAAKRRMIDDQRADDWADPDLYIRYLKLLRSARLIKTGPRRLDVRVAGDDTGTWGHTAGELLDAATADNPKLPDTAAIVEVTPGHHALIW